MHFLFSYYSKEAPKRDQFNTFNLMGKENAPQLNRSYSQ